MFSGQALAACTWRESYSYFDSVTESMIKVGGCGQDENIGSDCVGASPSDKYACCCEGVINSLNENPTVYTPAPFQVEIPGMKQLSTISCPAGEKCAIPWIGEYISGIYNYALSIVGILAAIMLMAGGLMWLISAGDSSKINQAKEIILGSISGLIILVISYIILAQINPGLVNFPALMISGVKKVELNLAVKRYDTTSFSYKDSPCATDIELANGVNFYATGYYKPTWEDSDNFRCVVAMQCSCPNGRDETKNCDSLYGKVKKNYRPCKPFSATTAYCNMTSSGTVPKDGDIAGPSNCKANLPAGTKVCFKGQTYTITDSGGAIKGKRIDIWSGNSLDKAYAVTGVGILKKGACN